MGGFLLEIDAEGEVFMKIELVPLLRLQRDLYGISDSSASLNQAACAGIASMIAA